MNHRSFWALLALLLSVALPRVARAQESLAIGGGTANFGVREMRNTQPGQGRIDVSVRTGGTLNVRPLNLHERCIGWVTREPDLILRVTRPAAALRVWVESARDTTLVINAHDGRWRCDDDSGGNGNPLVLLDEAGVGQYDIWVGSYARGVAVQGVLHVEPVAFANPASSTIATIGAVDLPRNFTPETRTLSIPAHPAGELDARWVSPNCRATITAQADAILRVGEDVPVLRFAAPQADPGAHIVLRGPDRQWYCGEAHRMPSIERPRAGNYHLWIGAVSPYARPPVAPRPTDGGVSDASAPTPSGPAMIGATRIEITRQPLLLTGVASGALATHELSPGFAPDPLVITVADREPGAVGASALSLYGCAGYVQRQPDVVLRLTDRISLLRVFAQANVDTTMVVHGPFGWRCSDDAFGFNPGTAVLDAEPGQYEVWLGSYAQGARHSGSITITTNPNARPVDPNQPATAPGSSPGSGRIFPPGMQPPGATPGTLAPPPPPTVNVEVDGVEPSATSDADAGAPSINGVRARANRVRAAAPPR